VGNRGRGRHLAIELPISNFLIHLNFNVFESYLVWNQIFHFLHIKLKLTTIVKRKGALITFLNNTILHFLGGFNLFEINFAIVFF
jgi:hypothetical protein